MDFEALKLNVLNAFALSLQLVQIERVIALGVGLTALSYNLMKIYAWLKKNEKI